MLRAGSTAVLLVALVALASVHLTWHVEPVDPHVGVYEVGVDDVGVWIELRADGTSIVGVNVLGRVVATIPATWALDVGPDGAEQPTVTRDARFRPIRVALDRRFTFRPGHSVALVQSIGGSPAAACERRLELDRASERIVAARWRSWGVRTPSVVPDPDETWRAKRTGWRELAASVVAARRALPDSAPDLVDVRPAEPVDLTDTFFPSRGCDMIPRPRGSSAEAPFVSVELREDGSYVALVVRRQGDYVFHGPSAGRWVVNGSLVDLTPERDEPRIALFVGATQLYTADGVWTYRPD